MAQETTLKENNILNNSILNQIHYYNNLRYKYSQIGKVKPEYHLVNLSSEFIIVKSQMLTEAYTIRTLVHFR